MLRPIRVLMVEDHRDWRKLVRLMLQMRPEWQIICEVSDGLESVQKAEELKPEVVSMGRCNTCSESTGRSFKTKSFSWTLI